MSLPTRIFLLRHGTSLGNTDRTAYDRMPDWQIPLVDRGRDEAAEAGRALFDQLVYRAYGVYVSPYVRTLDTWREMAASLPMPAWVREDHRLREQEWSGRPCVINRAQMEAEREAYGAFWYRFDGGESGSDVLDRCQAFWRDLRDEAAADVWYPDTVVIVTHAFTLRVLLMAALRWTVDEFGTLARPGNCARHELRLNDDGRTYALTAPFPRKWEVAA